MRVLLTNDDGIHAPGILALRHALLDLPVGGRPRHAGPLAGPHSESVTRAPRHALLTVAPLTVQSATSHGVTFHEPLMIRDERFDRAPEHPGIAVDGRPADCVKLALTNLWPERFGEGQLPDLVISGMNAGANCGINVIYSGTVAAAIEAAFLGVPSIAVSLMLGKGTPNFELGALWARTTIDRLLAAGLPSAHECLNINLPPTEGLSLDAPMPPIHVCPMNTHGLVDKYERRTSPGGEVYYWAAGYGLDFRDTEPGTDVDHLLKGSITVTPLKFDLTRHDALPRWASRLANTPAARGE
ncbi:MAG: 5'/3'-nucleotidase SurE [Tepidisphaera sp.]|nr:5'/3'-nucleotidase SurE [Tepidisphaera sp.]